MTTGRDDSTEGCREMKIRIELLDTIPDTVRMNAEWRIAFQLTRFAGEIDEVFLTVTEGQGAGRRAFQCEASVKIKSEVVLSVHETADHPAEAVSAGIDRIASSMRRLVRRTSRVSSNRGS